MYACTGPGGWDPWVAGKFDLLIISIESKSGHRMAYIISKERREIVTNLIRAS